MSSGFVPDDARDALIWERHCRGESVRQIAAAMELSKSYVHKIVSRLRPVSDAEVSENQAPADPILGLLTAEDMAQLGVTVADVASGLDALTRYRIQGLQNSAAGDAARRLFDHGRGGDAFGAWLHAGRVPAAAVAPDPVPAHVRDDRIVERRREGWTLAQIGAEVGMTKGAVSRALDRIYAGRPGQQPRG